MQRELFEEGLPVGAWAFGNRKSGIRHALAWEGSRHTLCGTVWRPEGGFVSRPNLLTCDPCRKRWEELASAVPDEWRLLDERKAAVFADWLEERGDPFAEFIRFALTGYGPRWWLIAAGLRGRTLQQTLESRWEDKMIGGFYVHGHVAEVVDGDTVDIRVGGLVFRVRLRDCWAPEKVARGGDQFEKQLGLIAKEQLRQLLPVGTEVRVDVSVVLDGNLRDWITFGRMVGDVTTAGEDKFNPAEHLIAMGLAARTKDELRELIERRRREEGEA